MFYIIPFPSYDGLLVRISLAKGDRFTLTPSLGMTPCKYPDKLYLSRN